MHLFLKFKTENTIPQICLWHSCLRLLAGAPLLPTSSALGAPRHSCQNLPMRAPSSHPSSPDFRGGSPSPLSRARRSCCQSSPACQGPSELAAAVGILVLNFPRAPHLINPTSPSELGPEPLQLTCTDSIWCWGPEGRQFTCQLKSGFPTVF